MDDFCDFDELGQLLYSKIVEAGGTYSITLTAEEFVSLGNLLHSYLNYVTSQTIVNLPVSLKAIGDLLLKLSNTVCHNEKMESPSSSCSPLD
jgi:hypothetical protein